jgi:hypothetical protein
MSSAHPLVLIADDYKPDYELVVRYLPRDYERAYAEDFLTAKTILDTRHVYMAIIDLFLDADDATAYGIEILKEYPHVPVMLMSGKNPERTEDALRKLDDHRLRLVNKDKDFENREMVEANVRHYLGKHYNTSIAIDFQNRVASWWTLADKLQDERTAHETREQLALEIEWLARKAFCEWDESKSEYVSAAHILVQDVIESSDNSVVMRMRPFSVRQEAQADVIFKVTKASEEHSKFDEYKNLLGGYGLREHRYTRTCHFHGQVYAVPYYRYEETKTYADFYRGADDSADDLTRIDKVTRYLFNNALGHLNKRAPTGRAALRLSDYYAKRIKLDKRRDAITRDLTPNTTPMGIRNVMDGDGDCLNVRIGNQMKPLRNPFKPVLVDRAYGELDAKVDAALRHGDLHTYNVLVDPSRVCCWYIDYESFGAEHYVLVDHVEMEASILFSLMEMSEDFDFLARLADAIMPTSSLKDVRDISAETDNPIDAREARKAYAAIKAIRASADNIHGAHSPKPYYHALMYEALRAAGKASKDYSRRWHALITAAQLFEKIESPEI